MGTANLTFFRKNKNPDTSMGAKLKSKTHLLYIRFLIFLAVFSSFCFKV
jgi:hypothetical protein